MTSRLTLSVLTLALACSPERRSSSPADYGSEAQAAYEAAMFDFRDEDCIEAEPAFSSIRQHYPYSRFAALAELRIADCKMLMSQWAEATGAYEQFLRFRPSHSEVPYARFQIAKASFEEIPDGWLLSPPSHERDPGPTLSALSKLRRFVLDFADDERVPAAREMILTCVNILAEHELYAAKFYARRDAHAAVVVRLRTLLSQFGDSSLAPEAWLMLGETQLEQGDRTEARLAFEELVTRFPQSDEASSARSALTTL